MTYFVNPADGGSFMRSISLSGALVLPRSAQFGVLFVKKLVRDNGVNLKSCVIAHIAGNVCRLFEGKSPRAIVDTLLLELETKLISGHNDYQVSFMTGEDIAASLVLVRACLLAFGHNPIPHGSVIDAQGSYRPVMQDLLHIYAHRPLYSPFEYNGQPVLVQQANGQLVAVGDGSWNPFASGRQPRFNQDDDNDATPPFFRPAPTRVPRSQHSGCGK